MGIRQYKPTTPGRRQGSVSDFADCTHPKVNRPEKSLLVPYRKKGGRNNQGVITSRFRGGGHKRMYRIIDFKRRKDGVWAIETAGEARGTSKHFFSVTVGAELCGPCFTPDDLALFVAVQHPGEEDAEGNPGTFENPSTRWPDFSDAMPVRPAVVVITKQGGGVIGS